MQALKSRCVGQHMSFILPDVGTLEEEPLASPETLQEALSGGEERLGHGDLEDP